ncbi:MAG: hypothetical protein ACI4I8_04425 [Oscillospiraceae bacterium]
MERKSRRKIATFPEKWQKLKKEAEMRAFPPLFDGFFTDIPL